MGTHGNRHLKLGTLVLLILTLLPASGFPFARPEGPQYVPNQVLVTLAPGRTEADLAGLIAQYGLTIARKPRFSNTYVLEIPGTGTPVDGFLANKDAVLRTNPGVQYLSRNYYLYLTDIPNDEFYPTITDPLIPTFLSGQWQFRANKHIFAPEGWDFQKGAKNVVVAVIDTGVRDRNGYNDQGKLVRIIHPDLQGRVLMGVDIADAAEDRALDPSPSENPRMSVYGATHGTHVAGIIAAQANNWIGIAGLCWDNVQILPIKIFMDTGTGTVIDEIEGIYYAMWWSGGTTLTGDPMKVNVINLSVGHDYRMEEEESVIKQAVRQGIVVVAAAGNFWDFGAYAPSYPAAYPDSICVGATEYQDEITDFSQRGSSVDITAPGYEVLSTVWFKAFATVDKETDTPTTPSSLASLTPYATVWPQPNPMPVWPDKYGNSFESMLWDGTSMSSPHAAAAAALLISHGVPPTDVKPILYETATQRGIGRPNDTYGWGLLNVYGALKKASIDVDIGSPSKGGVVTTTRPRIRVNLRHAKLASIRVWVDGVDSTGDGVPDNEQVIGFPIGDTNSTDDQWKVQWGQHLYSLDEKAGKKYLLFEYTVKPELAVNGMHRVYVSAATDVTFEVPPPVPLSDSDSALFKLNPQKLGTGWRLFTVPFRFSEPKKPEQTMGSAGILARWHYASDPEGEYALYSLDRSRTDDEATFTPTSAFVNSLVQPLGFSQGTPPAGLGYWLYLPEGSDVTIPDGYGEAMEQWPYVISLYYGWNLVGDPFPFAVDWSNVVVEYAGARLTAEEAAAAGWLSSAIFRYDSTYGRYTWKDIGSAVMVPWEAQWARVKVRTPDLTPSSTAAWSDEFTDGVIDQLDVEPNWYVGNTGGSVVETSGMLTLAGISGQASYTYVTNKDFPIYSDFIVDAGLTLTDVSPTLTGGPSNAEIRFRANSSGVGYAVAFRANDTPTTVSLRRSDSGLVINSKQVVQSLASKSAFYVSITAVGSHIKVKVGTFPGQGNVADWELEDSTFTGPGSFRLVNDGMMDCRWDYFRYRPVSVRPADVKLIVAPNPYTGAVQ